MRDPWQVGYVYTVASAVCKRAFLEARRSWAFQQLGTIRDEPVGVVGMLPLQGRVLCSPRPRAALRWPWARGFSPRWGLCQLVMRENRRSRGMLWSNPVRRPCRGGEFICDLSGGLRTPATVCRPSGPGESCKLHVAARSRFPSTINHPPSTNGAAVPGLWSAVCVSSQRSTIRQQRGAAVAGCGEIRRPCRGGGFICDLNRWLTHTGYLPSALRGGG